MAAPLYYGPCEGGPYHFRKLAHPEPVSREAIDKHTNRAKAGVQAGEDYYFGEYHWDAGAWRWKSAPENL